MSRLACNFHFEWKGTGAFPGSVLFMIALMFVPIAAGWTHIMERGIGGWQFLRWDRIESYRREGPAGNILAVEVWKRLPFRRTARFPIPVARKDAVAQPMAKYAVSGREGERVG